MTDTTTPTPPPVPAGGSFAYLAQTADQRPMSGTIDAASVGDAQEKLHALNLRVIEVRPERLARPKRMGGEDLITFNQQLAQLAQAGLPLEHGLRLIATDMRSRRLGSTVREIAAELERGTPVAQAFDRHADKFPPLYGRLVAAGVQSNNLPAMLMNIGRHMELVHRLRAAIWRAAAYPLVVALALSLVVAFIGAFIVPQFELIFADFGVRLPAVTQLLIDVGSFLPAVGLTIAILIIALPLVWTLLRATGIERAISDAVLLPMPLIGPVLRRNLIARWCDVVRIGVDAGVDLPAAVRLAGDAVGSRRLVRDGEAIIDALSHGRTEPEGSLRLLPRTVPAAMALSVREGQLSDTLATLSRMYQEQAELRLSLVPAVLTPVLLMLVAAVIGFIVIALFAPMISLVQSVSGS